MDESRIESILEQWSRAVDDNSALLASGYAPRTTIEELVDKYTKDPESEQTTSVKQVRPWNYEDFLERVRTYKPTTWFAKPHSISPLQCSRFGWYNSANDELKCSNCNSTIRHDISSDDSGHALAEQLSTSHTDICPWHDNSCPESFTQFPARSSQHIREEFNARVKHILSLLRTHAGCDCACPDGFLESLGDANFTAFVARLQSTGVLTVPSASTDSSESSHTRADEGMDVLEKAVLLAIFGWDRCLPDHRDGDGNTAESMGDRLECKLCGRRLQLQYFSTASTATNSSSSGNNENMQHKRAKLAKPILNPASEHRSYCPWVLSHDTDSTASTALANGTVGGDAALLDATSSTLAEAWSIAGWRVCLQILNAAVAERGVGVQFPATPDARGSEQSTRSQPVTPEEAYYKIKKVLDFASRST